MPAGVGGGRPDGAGARRGVDGPRVPFGAILVSMSEDSDVVVTEDGRRLRPVQSVERAIGLLDILGSQGEPMGVTELATAIGCSKTATYNLITTLELRGLVRKGADNRYALGWRLLELGEIVRISSTFGEAAKARLEGLAELTGETAVLAVLDNDTVFCVEMAESRRSVPITFTPGHREPLETSAAGQALLAFAPPGRRRRFLDDGARRAPGLAEILEHTRTAGYAIVGEGSERGLISIAAPVFDYRREVVAALSLIGPATRFSPQRLDELTRTLRDEARGISQTLGSAGFPAVVNRA